MVTIRPLRAEDADIIVGFNENTDEDFLDQWAGRGYTWPITREQITRRLREDGANSRFFAALLDGAVIGTAELCFIDWEEKSCSFGRYLLGEAYHNQGYGTEILTLLCRHAFDALGMKKIRLTVLGFNTGAYRCYCKVGFKAVSEEIRPNGWKVIRMELEGKP